MYILALLSCIYYIRVALTSLQDLCFLTNGDPPAWLPNTLELELSLGLELLETVLREYPHIFMKVREGGKGGEGERVERKGRRREGEGGEEGREEKGGKVREDQSTTHPKQSVIFDRI